MSWGRAQLGKAGCRGRLQSIEYKSLTHSVVVFGGVTCERKLRDRLAKSAALSFNKLRTRRGRRAASLTWLRKLRGLLETSSTSTLRTLSQPERRGQEF